MKANLVISPDQANNFTPLRPIFVWHMQSIYSKPTVGVVILNWNGKDYLKRFLPPLLSSTYDPLVVYVADNGSTDDSVGFVRDHFPTVRLIELNKNLGFAGGYNEALKQVDEEILVLLNSDVAVSPGWIEPAVALFEEDVRIAALQPKILDQAHPERFEYAGAAGGWLDVLGYPFSKGRIFDVLEKDEHQYDQSEEIFWASGAAMFIRKSVFFETGGFDPCFFAHQEEIDLCWRMHLAGYRVLSCPQSVVYHIGGGTLAKNNPKKIFLNFRNNLIMLWKNLEGPQAIAVMLIRFALDAISAYKNLFSGQPGYFIAVAKAHFAFMGWLFSSKTTNVFPNKRSGSVAGMYKGSIVFQHFIKGRTRFSEIIRAEN